MQLATLNASSNRCIHHMFVKTQSSSLALKMAFVTPSLGGSASANKNMFSTTSDSHRSGVPATPARQWYRSWNNEYERYFYWDGLTSQSTWDAPPLNDVVIDYATQKPVVREETPASTVTTALAQNVFNTTAATNTSTSLSG